MIGMSFLSFLVLLVIAVVVAAVFHFGFRYRFIDGWDTFLGEIGLGWLGGWLGSLVLGHWLFNVDNVYVVPAILGAVSAVGGAVLWWKALAKVYSGRVGL